MLSQSQEQYVEISVLIRQGLSIRAIPTSIPASGCWAGVSNTPSMISGFSGMRGLVKPAEVIIFANYK